MPPPGSWLDRHHGNVPATTPELLALPGIGRYTAGAVASIAFGLPEPVVDGNVMRVLSRLTGFDRDISRRLPIRNSLGNAPPRSSEKTKRQKKTKDEMAWN